MSTMSKPDMKVVLFEEGDIVAASSVNTMTLTGLGDSLMGTAKIGYGNKVYDGYTHNGLQAFYNAFGAANSTSIGDNTTIIFGGQDSDRLENIILYDREIVAVGDYNGTYVWNNGRFEYRGNNQ